MKHSLAIFGALLVWSTPDCGADHLVLYEVYINGPGMGVSAYSDGTRSLPATQTSFELGGSTKPVPDCALAWRVPVAVDAMGAPLPESCQPVMVSVDGQPMWPEGT